MIGSVTAVLDDWPVLVRLVDSSIDYIAIHSSIAGIQAKMWNVHHLLLDIRALDMSVIEPLHYSQRVLQWSPIRTTTDVPVV